MSGAATLDALRTRGYRASLDLAELVVRGPGPVPDDLRREIVADTVGLKAAVLLADPPGWLSRLVELYRSGRTWQVKRTAPKVPRDQQSFDLGLESGEAALPYPDNLNGGKTVACEVSMTIKAICAAVAAEIGAPVLEWERLRPEVEEALGRWSK